MEKQRRFAGTSIPRNRELMRVYRDLELVEQLGSGIPRILQSYGRECFVFLPNFTRMVFPSTEPVTPQVTDHVTDHVVKLVKAIGAEEMSLPKIMDVMELKHRRSFTLNYLRPTINLGLAEMTIPDRPKSINQKYRLTAKGLVYREKYLTN